MEKTLSSEEIHNLVNIGVSGDEVVLVHDVTIPITKDKVLRFIITKKRHC